MGIETTNRGGAEGGKMEEGLKMPRYQAFDFLPPLISILPPVSSPTPHPDARSGSGSRRQPGRGK